MNSCKTKFIFYLLDITQLCICFPVFHLQISERDELLHYFYSKFEKSFIAGLCKELARGTHQHKIVIFKNLMKSKKCSFSTNLLINL